MPFGVGLVVLRSRTQVGHLARAALKLRSSPQCVWALIWRDCSHAVGLAGSSVRRNSFLFHSHKAGLLHMLP